MTTARLPRVLVATALVGLVTATGGCGSHGGPGGGASSAVEPDAPFGPACDALPAQGPGSLAAMATVPVATAVGANPLTTALAQAVLAAHLVDASNSRRDITVLAPADVAFQALDPAQLDALTSDVPRLTTLLTHHALPGRLTPPSSWGSTPRSTGARSPSPGRAPSSPSPPTRPWPVRRRPPCSAATCRPPTPPCT